MSVEWKPLIYANIPEGVFVISSDGDVKAIDGKSSVRIFRFQCGRIKVSMHYNGKVYHEVLPRLVAIAFIPTPFGFSYERFSVFFKDGNKQNVNASNLEWGLPGGKHSRSYSERKEFLDFVYNHKTLSIHDCAQLYTKTTGRPVSEHSIRALYAGHINNLDLFGYTLDDFNPIYEGIKLPNDTVHKICQLIVKCNGNARMIHKEAAKLFPDIKQEAIDRIRLKVSYVPISDQYFEYYGRGEFYIVKK